MKQQLATPVLMAAALFFAMNVGAGIYQHLFGIPAMFSSSEALKNYGGMDEQAPVFWMVLHLLIVATLTLSLIFNWRNAARKKFLWIALGGYVFVSLVSIYFAAQLKVFIELPANGTEFFERTRRWLTLSWFRVIILLGSVLMVLTALSKPSSGRIL